VGLLWGGERAACPDWQTDSTFSEAEAAQLCELFELSEEQLTLLLSGSAYIFEARSIHLICSPVLHCVAWLAVCPCLPYQTTPPCTRVSVTYPDPGTCPLAGHFAEK
jgi:hypothetical protein